MRRFCFVLFVLALAARGATAQAPSAPEQLPGARVAEQVAPAVVMVLTGRGAGQLESVGSGLVVRADGVVLTAYHLVKGAREVQVRLKNGEVFDRVELIAFDERRDVAALRLSAVGLPVVMRSNSPEVRVGDPVYVVSHPKGLPWTVSSGILSGVRMADDVPGAGSGYQLLQHSAPISPGSSGGALVDAQGYTLGIIVGSGGGQNLNFAVPLASVAGLANGAGRTPFGAGSELRPPEPVRPPAASAVLATDPNEILRHAKIIYVSSNSSYIEAVQVQNELRKRPEFAAWQLAIVDSYESRKIADIQIEVDRPLFTFTFTYRVTDRRTSIILATGKVNAWDGNVAAPKLAKRIVEDIRKVRALPAKEEKDSKSAQKESSN